MRTAPSEKFGAWNTGRRSRGARASTAAVSKPRRADDDRDSRREAALDVLRDRVGPREVDRRVAAVELPAPVDDLVSAASSAGSSTDPTLPPLPKSATFTRASESRPGFTRATASRK